MLRLPLLSTKFHVPPLRDNLVPRPRLLQKLNEGLHRGCRLSLVSAPAGYGKTTLVSSWLHAVREAEPGGDARAADGLLSPRYAWLTLDEGDNDLSRFLAYLVVALRRIEPDVGESVLATLQFPRPLAVDRLATLLVNELTSIPNRFILILDDYHRIAAQPVHDLVAFLVDHQPPKMSLVIASRADPPLALVRLRARGQLAEVRQADLCFNRQETEQFASRTMDLGLNRKQLDALVDRTEGWVTGLQLAALSVVNVQDISSFVGGLSGTYEQIAGYLTGEVLARQPEARLTFLLQTSILDRLSGSLCAAVTGQAGAQTMLEQLCQANLFLFPLDHRSGWFRYHTLFADLLRQRLYETHGEAVAELHRRAGRWYQTNGEMAPAVEHALAANDHAWAAELVAAGAEGLIRRNETGTLLRWLEALPRERRQARPILVVLHALALLLGGKPLGPVERDLDTVVASGKAEAVRGEIATIRALWALMAGDTTETVRLGELALGHLPEQRSYYRSLAADSLGMAHTLRGDTAAAMQAFEMVVATTAQTDHVGMTLAGLANLAGLRFMMGQLRAAAIAYQQVLDVAAERIRGPWPTTGKALLGLGELAREWNDLDGALRYFTDAEAVLGDSSEIGLAIAYLSLARVRATLGDWDSAQDFLAKARLKAQESTATPLDDRLAEGLQVRFWILRGELDLAAHWAGERGLLARTGEAPAAPAERDVAPDELAVADNLTLARLFLALEKPDRALKTLAPLLATLEQKAQLRRVIEVLVLQALACQQKGDIASASRALGRALSLAEPEGYLRTFLDEGEPMASLLYASSIPKGLSTYRQRLLTAFAAEQAVYPGHRPASLVDSLVEPLSPRELEVLKLIAEGLSNREIAGRLHVSLSTVKGHTANIYGKLQVHSRTRAVAKARSLGLLLAGRP